jgi:hypothetical protein
LPQHPAILVFHSVQKESPEWIDRRFTGEAIINVLVIFVGFEPEFVRIAKEQQAEE